MGDLNKRGVPADDLNINKPGGPNKSGGGGAEQCSQSKVESYYYIEQN